MSPRRSQRIILLGLLAASAIGAAGPAAASAAVTLTSTAPSPASQTIQTGQSPAPITLTATGSTDLTAWLSVLQDTGADCAPTLAEQEQRSSNRFGGQYEIPAGTFSKDVQINAPGAGTWTVCLYLRRNGSDGFQETHHTAGQYTVTEESGAKLALSAPAPAVQTWDYNKTKGVAPTFNVTATGTSSVAGVLGIYASSGTACPAAPPARPDRATWVQIGQESVSPGSFSIPFTPSGGQLGYFGSIVVCGYLNYQSPTPVAAATAGVYTIQPPACPRSSFTVGTPKQGDGIGHWVLPFDAGGAAGVLTMVHPREKAYAQEFPSANATAVPMDDQDLQDLQRFGKVTITFTATWQPSADTGYTGTGTGCVAADGSIIHSLPSSTQTITVTLFMNGSATIKSGAGSTGGATKQTLKSVIAKGVLALPTQRFSTDGTATVELYLAAASGSRVAASAARKIRIGKLTKVVRKDKPVVFKVKLTAAGKKALKRAGSSATVTVRTTFRPKGGGKRSVTTKKITLK